MDKEKREGWRWSDEEVDPWSGQGIKGAILLIAGAGGLFSMFFNLFWNWNGGFKPLERFFRQELPLGLLLTAGVAVAVISIHQLGHLWAARRHDLPLRRFMLWGWFRDETSGRLVWEKFEVGRLMEIRLKDARPDLVKCRAVMAAGFQANLWAGGIALVLLLLMPGKSFGLTFFLAVFAWLSLSIGLLTAIPWRLGTAFLSDGYWVRLIDRDPAAAREFYELQENFFPAFRCRPRDWDLDALLAKFPRPEDTPFRDMLKLAYARDTQDCMAAGMILEEAFESWPRRRCHPLTGLLIASAAEFFTIYVDDPERARHYEKLLVRNFGETADLLHAKLARLVRAEKRAQAEKLAQTIIDNLKTSPPVLLAFVQQQTQSILNLKTPPITREAWAEHLARRLGDA